MPLDRRRPAVAACGRTGRASGVRAQHDLSPRTVASTPSTVPRALARPRGSRTAPSPPVQAHESSGVAARGALDHLAHGRVLLRRSRRARRRSARGRAAAAPPRSRCCRRGCRGSPGRAADGRAARSPRRAPRRPRAWRAPGQVLTLSPGWPRAARGSARRGRAAPTWVESSEWRSASPRPASGPRTAVVVVHAEGHAVAAVVARLAASRTRPRSGGPNSARVRARRASTPARARPGAARPRPGGSAPRADTLAVALGARTGSAAGRSSRRCARRTPAGRRSRTAWAWRSWSRRRVRVEGVALVEERVDQLLERGLIPPPPAPRPSRSTMAASSVAGRVVA